MTKKVKKSKQTTKKSIKRNHPEPDPARNPKKSKPQHQEPTTEQTKQTSNKSSKEPCPEINQQVQSFETKINVIEGKVDGIDALLKQKGLVR